MTKKQKLKIQKLIEADKIIPLKYDIIENIFKLSENIVKVSEKRKITKHKTRS